MAKIDEQIQLLLTKYMNLGAESVRNDVRPLSATGETVESVNPVVFREGTAWHGQIRGRQFFSALETGRGPRQSGVYQEFDKRMLEYMDARGIGADLSEKKRKQLARFLAYKINKFGDETFQAGGRQVYSDNLRRVISELRRESIKKFRNFVVEEIKNEFNRK